MHLLTIANLRRVGASQREGAEMSAGQERPRPAPPAKPAYLLAAMAVLALAATPSANANPGERNRSVGTSVVDAATKPLEDLNFKSREIPEILRAAELAPYDISGIGNCTDLRGAIGILDDVLGPDADADAEGRGIVRGALSTGGDVLSGFIPFRGVVRTLSGAKKKRAELEEAIYAGVARRSYLKGFAAAKNCKLGAPAAIETAEQVLGLAPAGETAPTQDWRAD